jgi:hypothetical protein
LYGLAAGFACVGLLVLVWAAINREGIIEIAGSVASSLFWRAVRSARQTRKESIAIRLLEAPLSRADKSKEAADMLRQFFDKLMLEKPTAAAAKAGATGANAGEL